MSKGSRSRPRQAAAEPTEAPESEIAVKTEGQITDVAAAITPLLNGVIIKSEPGKKHMQIIYPSKRYPDRENFLKNWKDSFSK